MITALLSRLMILTFGTLYPAYASFKAVRNKDVREYCKWMKYWIVFALFTCVETFTDALVSFWFPFYYEIKVALVFWLLSPSNSGASFLYKNVVHPGFLKREEEIDEMILQAKEQGSYTVLLLGSKTVGYATNVIMRAAMRSIQISGSALSTGTPDGSQAVADVHMETGNAQVPPMIDEDIDDITFPQDQLEDLVRRTTSSPNLRRSNRLLQRNSQNLEC